MSLKSLNEVKLIGALGRDPEIKYASNGNAIANLSIATSESWTDKATGQRQERTEWHRVVIFGKMAEVAGQYLTKGSQVFIEGKLQTRKWQDQNTGQDRYSTEIVVDFDGKMIMLGGGNRNNDGGNAGYAQQPVQQAPVQPQAQAQGYQQAPVQQQAQAQANNGNGGNNQGYQQQPQASQPAPASQPHQAPMAQSQSVQQAQAQSAPAEAPVGTTEAVDYNSSDVGF